MIFRYLESLNIDIKSKCILGKYLRFVSKKAEGMFFLFLKKKFFLVVVGFLKKPSHNFYHIGKLPTTAKWIRNFVQNHPKYNHDSVVSQEINYDLIRMVEKIQNGQVKFEGLMDL